MTDDVEAVARVCAAIIGCEASIVKNAPEPFVDACISYPPGCQCHGYAEQFVAALRSLGWQKVEPGMVVVPRRREIICESCFARETNGVEPNTDW